MYRRTSLTLSRIAVPASAAELATVYRLPSCGCCEAWIAYRKSNGFEATVISTDDLGAVKANMHVPTDMQSCHTAQIGGYVVEAHVPVEAIVKLLAQKPQVTGIADARRLARHDGTQGTLHRPRVRTCQENSLHELLSDPRRGAERGTAARRQFEPENNL